MELELYSKGKYYAIPGRFFARIISAAFIVIAVTTMPGSAGSSANDTFAVVYFHGAGCTHCQNVNENIFSRWLESYPDLVVIDYEINRDQENGRIFLMYGEVYNIGNDIPMLFFSPNMSIAEDYEILQKSPEIFRNCTENRSYREEVTIPFGTLDLVNLPGNPCLWHGDRVLIKTGSGGNNTLLRRLMLDNNLSESLDELSYRVTTPVPLYYSENVTGEFQHAIVLEGWTLQWGHPGTSPPISVGTGEKSGALQTSLFFAPVLSVLIGAFFIGKIKNMR